MDFTHVHQKRFKNIKLLRRQRSIHCELSVQTSPSPRRKRTSYTTAREEKKWQSQPGWKAIVSTSIINPHILPKKEKKYILQPRYRLILIHSYLWVLYKRKLETCCWQMGDLMSVFFIYNEGSSCRRIMKQTFVPVLLSLFISSKYQQQR